MTKLNPYRFDIRGSNMPSFVDGDVPASSVPQDGGALLHRQEQVQVGGRLLLAWP